MAETEKITVNLSVVDLGKIDLLVEEGFYSNRTDMIRMAIRNEIASHADAVEQITVRKAYSLGVIGYSQADLARRREAGEMLDLRVVGLLHLSADVTPELALATLRSVNVRGVFNAPVDVKAALEEAGRVV